jgi:hypothetical protein
MNMTDLKVIDGGVVTDIEARAHEAKAVLLNDDTTRLQLMTARILKAMGKRVSSRVSLGALAVVVGKVFTVIPQKEHGMSLAAFCNLVAMAIQSEYTPEQQEAARQMALAAQKLREEQNAKSANEERAAAQADSTAGSGTG